MAKTKKTKPAKKSRAAKGKASKKDQARLAAIRAERMDSDDESTRETVRLVQNTSAASAAARVTQAMSIGGYRVEVSGARGNPRGPARDTLEGYENLGMRRGDVRRTNLEGYNNIAGLSPTAFVVTLTVGAGLLYWLTQKAGETIASAVVGPAAPPAPLPVYRTA